MRAEVEPIAPVLVGGPADRRTVQYDLGEGVEAVAGEVDAAVTRLPVENGLVAPVLPPDPVLPQLVEVEIGVGEESRRHQVGVHRA
ncbi:hypothetical protein J8J27_22345, partial [Mycobacterium tuberculosis]|nr:hypothetical protein [Mycobacterium tuberculosis]